MEIGQRSPRAPRSVCLETPSRSLVYVRDVAPSLLSSLVLGVLLIIAFSQINTPRAQAQPQAQPQAQSEAQSETQSKAQPKAQPRLDIYAGASGGVYERMACLWGFFADQQKIPYRLIPSQGSLSNLAQVSQSVTPAMGIVQASDLAEGGAATDSAHLLDQLLVRLNYLKSERSGLSEQLKIKEFIDQIAHVNRQQLQLSDIGIVSTLYPESLHIVSRNPKLTKLTLERASGLRIGTSSVQSGSARDMLFLLGVMRVHFDREKHKFFPKLSDAFDALAHGQVDLVITSGLAPLPTVERALAARSDFHLVELSREIIQGATKGRPSRILTPIMSERYAQLEQNLATIGSEATWVTNQATPSRWIDALLTAQHRFQGSERGELMRDIRGWRCPLLSGEERDDWAVLLASHLDQRDEALAEAQKLSMQLVIPLHETTELHYKESRPLLMRFLKYLPLLLLILFCMVALQRLPKTRLGLYEWSGFLSLGILLALMWTLGTLLMYTFEWRSPHFSTISRSFWSISTYLFSGFEDKEPLTLGGRIVSISMIIGGVGVVAQATGEFASKLTARQLMADFRPLTHREDHLLICLDHVSQLSMVDMLLDKAKKLKFDGVVMVMMPEPPDRYHPVRVHLQTRQVRFLAGDMTSVDDLIRVRAAYAKQVIVVAQSEDPLRELLALNAVKSTCEQLRVHERERPRVLAWVGGELDRSIYLEAGADEVLSRRELGYGLLGQAVISPNISTVFSSLLAVQGATPHLLGPKASRGVGILTVSDKVWRERVLGETLSEVKRASIQGELVKGAQMIILGYRDREGKTHVNPRSLSVYQTQVAEHVMSEGELLIVLST